MMLFFVACAMGLAFCGPPGAVFAIAARRGVANGFTAALMVEIGSLVGDAVWAIVGLSSFGLLLQIAPVQGAIAAAGGLLLGWLGVRALLDAWHDRDPPVAPPSVRGDFATGAILSLTNPQAVAYWIAFGGSIEAIIGGRANSAQLAIFFTGFMVGCLVYCFLAATVIAGARSLITKSFYRVVNTVCGVALLSFAVLLIYDTSVRLIPALNLVGAFPCRYIGDPEPGARGIRAEARGPRETMHGGADQARRIKIANRLAVGKGS